MTEDEKKKPVKIYAGSTILLIFLWNLNL